MNSHAPARPGRLPLGMRRAAPRTSQHRKGSPSVTIAIWVLVVFMIVPEGFDYWAVTHAASMPTEGSPLSRTVWLALLGFGVITVARKWSSAVVLLRNVNPFLLGFVALAAMSTAWSLEPGVTIRRMIRVMTVLLDGMALALLSWHLQRFQQVVRPILTIMLVGSIIFVLVDPVLAIEQREQAELVGAWHGLATQKNGLGSIAAIGTILWLHAYLSKEGKSMLALIGLAVAVTCLLRSRSSTSIMATAFTCVLLVMLLRSPPGLRRYMPYFVGAFASMLLVYSLAVLNLIPGSYTILSPIAAIAGKDLTFSGRTAIWNIINEQIVQHPILGGGFGAFWRLAPDSPSYQFLTRLYFYPSQSHNGYMDVINDLGFVGMFCLLAFIWVFFKQSLKLFKNAPTRAQGALFLGILFHQLVGNLSESRWFNVLTIEFVIVTIAVVALGRCTQDLRAMTAPQRQARGSPPH